VTLTGQPTGTVATRVAGLADFQAVLEWDAADHRPASCLPAPGDFFRHALAETPSPCGRLLEVRGGIMALTERGLAGAVERVMRGFSDAAAVSGAVLEMRVVRESAPRGLRPDLVQALAVDLWRAGFPVRLAPCWDAVGAEGLALGTGGGDEGLREFLRDHPVWDPS
jgi:hypothetical protein